MRSPASSSPTLTRTMPFSGPLPDARLLGRAQVGGGVDIQIGRIVEQKAPGVAQRRGVGEKADPFGQGDGRAQASLQLEGEHPACRRHLA